MNENRQLNIGVLLPGWTVEAWAARTIERLLASPACTLAQAVRISSRRITPAPLPWLVERTLRQDQEAAGALDPFGLEDVRPLLGDLAIGTNSGASDLADADLDVVIDLTRDSGLGLDLDGLGTPVWSLVFSDTRDHVGGTPGLREWMERNPITGITLLSREPSGDETQVLYRVGCATEFTSIALTRANCFWKASEIVGREVERKASMGPEAYYRSRHRHGIGAGKSPRVLQTPGNLTFGLHLAGRFVDRIVQRVQRLVAGTPSQLQWVLMYAFRRSADDGPDEPPHAEISSLRYRPLVPPPGIHWADPFTIRWKDEDWILFEQVTSGEGGTGTLLAVQVNEAGMVGDPIEILERPYHLSYPFLLEWEDELFMIPESGEAGKVEALRCVDFPTTWEPYKTLMDGVKLYDATLLEHDGRWWLFGVVASIDHDSTHDEMFIFHADHPLSDRWIPHRENPVVSSVGCARPGGAILPFDGALYRPAQDSRVRYGKDLRMFRIDTLTPNHYEETEVGPVSPHWTKLTDGFHHVSMSESLVVVDAVTHGEDQETLERGLAS